MKVSLVKAPRLLRKIKFFRHLYAHPRLLIALAVALVCFFLMPDWSVLTRLLLSWNIFAWGFLVIMVPFLLGSGTEQLKRRAIALDESEFLILTLTIFAAIASFVGIFFQLAQLKEVHGTLKYLHMALVIGTVVSAWVFIQVMFALHYTHEFFIRKDYNDRDSLESSGGVRFPGAPKPEFLDFLYFSCVIGAATATADVEIWSKTIRRLALVHTIISYFFNAAILGLLINIVAGLT